MNIELNKNNNVDKNGQFGLIFSEQEKAKEKIIEKDSQGRTIQDIITQSGLSSEGLKNHPVSYNPETKEFYIGTELADVFILNEKELNEEKPDDFLYGRK